MTLLNSPAGCRCAAGQPQGVGMAAGAGLGRSRWPKEAERRSEIQPGWMKWEVFVGSGDKKAFRVSIDSLDILTNR